MNSDAANERRLDLEEAGRRFASRAPGDRFGAGWQERLDKKSRATRPEYGVVVDVLPGAHAYLVATPLRTVWCSAASTLSGFGLTGARALGGYAPGSGVWIQTHPEGPTHAVITAAEPYWSVHAGNVVADGVWPFVRSGYQAEAAHREVIARSAAAAQGGDVRLGGTEAGDWSAGRPIDGTAAGEWGAVTETGTAMFLDPWQAYLRVDESTGLFLFYPDQMVRLAAVNYQHFTGQSETEHLDDQGEIYACRRKVLYAHENYGLWWWNQVTGGYNLSAVENHGLAGGQGTVFNDPVLLQTGTGRAAREPESFAQISAARGLEFEGYLGQGGKTLIGLPAQGVPRADGVTAAAPSDAQPGGRVAGSVESTAPPNVRGGPTQPGVFEDHRTITGAMHLRVAKRFILVKRPTVHFPRPVLRPEDPYGDGPDNYAAGGLAAGSRAVGHFVRDELLPLTGPSSYDPAVRRVNGQVRACCLPDAVAAAFNWEGLHPFSYHVKDWAVADDADGGAVNQVVPTYSQLSTRQHLDAPAPVFLEVDHRYGTAAYYRGESAVCLLDDGTVVVYDGWGSELRMSGGEVSVRCPGDFTVHAGRRFEVRAGSDVIINAQNSVDVVAGNGDLRTMAARNSHHLSGNDGCGGFLFESKAVCPAYDYGQLGGADAKLGQAVKSSGFAVVCPKSQFSVTADDAILRVDADSSDGRIVLDAGQSKTIETRSKVLVNRVYQARVEVIRKPRGPFDPQDTDQVVNEFTADHSFFGGSVYASNSVVAYDSLVAGQKVASAKADDDGNWVFQADTLATELDVNARNEYLLETYRPALDAEVIRPPRAAFEEFSLRADSQYRVGSQGYKFYESRWLTMGYGAGQTFYTWVEPDVEGLRSEEVTQPYPGQTSWNAATGYNWMYMRYADPASQNAIARNANRAAYEASVEGPPGAGSLASYYVAPVPLPPP